MKAGSRKPEDWLRKLHTQGVWCDQNGAKRYTKHYPVNLAEDHAAKRLNPAKDPAFQQDECFPGPEGRPKRREVEQPACLPKLEEGASGEESSCLGQDADGLETAKS